MLEKKQKKILKDKFNSIPWDLIADIRATHSAKRQYLWQYYSMMLMFKYFNPRVQISDQRFAIVTTSGAFIPAFESPAQMIGYSGGYIFIFFQRPDAHELAIYGCKSDGDAMQVSVIEPPYPANGKAEKRWEVQNKRLLLFWSAEPASIRLYSISPHFNFASAASHRMQSVSTVWTIPKIDKIFDSLKVDIQANQVFVSKLGSQDQAAACWYQKSPVNEWQVTNLGV